MMVYICTKFHKNILNCQKVTGRTHFAWEKFSKRHNSIKLMLELRFLFSAHCLMMVYIYTKFHEIILNGMKVIERTRFSCGKFQRGIIPLTRRWSYGSCSLHIV